MCTFFRLTECISLKFRSFLVFRWMEFSFFTSSFCDYIYGFWTFGCQFCYFFIAHISCFLFWYTFSVSITTFHYTHLTCIRRNQTKKMHTVYYSSLRFKKPKNKLPRANLLNRIIINHHINLPLANKLGVALGAN